MIHKQLCRHEAWISKNIRCQYLFLLTRIFLYGFWLAGGWHGTTYHRQVDYLFDSLLRLTTKKTPNPLITDPWWDNRWTLPAKGQSWGLLSHFSPFRYFPDLSTLSKRTLPMKYHVYKWKASHVKKWMLFKKSERYFCKMENLLMKKLTNVAVEPPTPFAVKSVPMPCRLHENNDRAHYAVLLNVWSHYITTITLLPSLKLIGLHSQKCWYDQSGLSA